jgi:hypothetical protein
MGGIFTEYWRDVLTALGLAFTIAGFTFSIIMIWKTRKIAQEAKNAAIEAQDKIRRNVMLSDISSCEKTVNEVKTLIKGKKYESGLLRTGDLISQLIQIRSFIQGSFEEEPEAFQDSISQLAIIRGWLDGKMIDKGKEIDGKAITETLSKIADRLNGWIGKSKYTIPKGG